MTTMSLRDELASVEAQEKGLEERKREIYAASLAAPDDEKVVDDWMAKMFAEPSLFRSIEYPISVTGINFEPGEVWLGSHSKRMAVGDFVQVRPCDPEHEKHTYLGIYLGEVALSVGHRYHLLTGVLHVHIGHHNPAMYVPALKRVVLGCGSWWKRISTPDELKAITDHDIAALPYVELLKAQAGDAGAFDATKPAEQLADESIEVRELGEFGSPDYFTLKGDTDVTISTSAGKSALVNAIVAIINKARGKSTK